MNNIYIYEGGFISFVALVVELLKKEIVPDDIKLFGSYDRGLFDNEILLNIDPKKDNIDFIKAKLSKHALYCIYNVFLSDNKNKEMIIYDFLINYFKYGNNVFRMRRIDSVNDVIKISKYVRYEAHKLKGFLRFKKMKNNFYYGEITPTNNVIGFLAVHFSKRLKEDYWIIKDNSRCIYAIYDRRKITYLTEAEVVSLNLESNDGEEIIEDLWKTFHKTVAISARENKRCQQNFMPKKYWKDMLEMEEKI